MNLVPEAKNWYKLHSVQMAAIASALFMFAASNLDKLPSLENDVPTAWHAFAVFIGGVVIFAVPVLSRLVPQSSVTVRPGESLKELATDLIDTVFDAPAPAAASVSSPAGTVTASSVEAAEPALKPAEVLAVTEPFTPAPPAAPVITEAPLTDVELQVLRNNGLRT